MSNVCPQFPRLNRGIWRSLEKRVRDIAKQSVLCHVFSGAFFLPQGPINDRNVVYRCIGESDVAVPSHFFKVIQPAIWRKYSRSLSDAE